MSGLKIGPAGEAELTREAKEAVRGYMLYLITLPAIGLTIISAAAGFFINKVAFQSGYNEAYKTAVADVVKASKDVGIATSKADEALKTMNQEIENGRATIDASVKKATEASNEAMQTSEKAAQVLTSNTEQLAATLAGTETFRRAANTVAIPGFADLNGNVEKLRIRVDSFLQSLNSLTLYQSNCAGASISPCEVSCADPQERLIGGLCLVPGGGGTGFVQNVGMVTNTRWSCALGKVPGLPDLAAVRALAYCVKIPK
jgi:hypothetical protein